MTTTPFEERRRNRPWINLRHLGIAGRRRTAPQPRLARNRYVDLYEPVDLLIVMLQIIEAAGDALMTLRLIEHGAQELNWLMAFWLVNDPDYFVQSKLLITALSVIFLTIHKNFVLFGRIAVSTLLRTACGGYLTLLGYEVALLTLIA